MNHRPQQQGSAQGRAPSTPAWEAALLEELRRADRRLLYVYEIYRASARNCTAAHVSRELARQIGPFAPSERNCRRLLQLVRETDARHNPDLRQP